MSWKYSLKHSLKISWHLGKMSKKIYYSVNCFVMLSEYYATCMQ